MELKRDLRLKEMLLVFRRTETNVFVHLKERSQ